MFSLYTDLDAGNDYLTFDGSQSAEPFNGIIETHTGLGDDTVIYRNFHHNNTNLTTTGAGSDIVAAIDSIFFQFSEIDVGDDDDTILFDNVTTNALNTVQGGKGFDEIDILNSSLFVEYLFDFEDVEMVDSEILVLVEL